MDDFTAHIPAAALRAALVCVSNEETRYYLQGVHVEPVGGQLALVSTDGHRLFAARVTPDLAPDGVMPPASIIIPTAAVKRALTGYKADLIMIRREGSRHTVGDIQFTPVDGTFPEWRRVFPNLDEMGKPAQFNPALMADLHKVAKALLPGRRGPASSHLHHMGAGPALATFSGVDFPAVVLLMPWRSEGKDRAELRFLLDDITRPAPADQRAEAAA